MDTLDNVADIYPLTPAQKGLLYQTLLANTDALNRTQSRDNIHGEFQSDLFRQALSYLVSRHDSLRCLFLHLGLDEPVTVVRQQVDLPLFQYDLSALNSDDQQDRLRELAEQSMKESLALDEAPLFRVTLVKLSDSLSQVIFDIHHLIFDGWSSAVFFSELQAVYGAIRANQEIDLPPAGRYKDHVLKLASQNGDALQLKWSTRLKGFLRPTSLPLNRDHSPEAFDEQFANGSFRQHLDERTNRQLSELARRNRVTMSTLIEAAWALALARYNNTEDVLIGVTMNGRTDEVLEHERTFGLFVNTLPMRIRCNESLPLDRWLTEVQAEKAFLTQNHSASLADIHAASELGPGVNLFEALMVYQEFPDIGTPEDPPIRFSSVGIHENSPLPLVIHIFNGARLEFLALHIEEQLTESVAKQLLGHCLNILSAMALVRNGSDVTLQDINMLSKSDVQALMNLSSSEPSLARRDQSLHGRFIEQARRTPENIAIRDSSGALRYDELLEEALRIKRWLVQANVAAGDVIAVCFERSVNQYSAILGVLMSDAAFLPLDPEYPAARQEYMLKDSNVRVVLTDSNTPRRFNEEHRAVLAIDAPFPAFDGNLASATFGMSESRTGPSNQSVLHDPETAAYVMYTSGSTGVPKGVAGSHLATLNRLEWMWDAYPFADDEVCCQKTSLSFVDSIGELFGPLLKGIPTVVIDDDSVVNADRFVDELRVHRITRVVLLPSYLSVLLDSIEDISESLAGLRICVVSGEALLSDVANRFLQQLPACELLNLYGSTEISADVTCFAVKEAQKGARVPIGRPIRGSQMYILDRLGRLMPPGTPGELCVAGAALANGYLGQEEELNERRFKPNSFGEGRLFLTGDLGRHRSDGIIVHEGRKDAQIKIRGHRIEPVEIERTLSSFEGVRAALVNTPEEDRLHAYYRVKQGSTVNPEELDEYVRLSLPEHMIPQFLLPIEDFPRLPNGKIDRKALPLPLQLADRIRIPPRTETEQVIARIWQDILGVPEPSVYDNFVSSGGSSLSGMRFNARVYREFGSMVLPRVLLTANLAQIALQLNPDDVPEPVAGQHTVDRIEPLYFGSDARPLYGTVHLPARPGLHSPVLLCSSIGHEYMRLHRSYQMLATELARRGHLVLRFDYSGVGDSSGDSSDATMEQWCEDVRAAADLLGERSGGQPITAVGVRLGVPILFGAGLTSVQQYIAWDPVCEGRDYLSHLKALHVHAMSSLDRYRFRQRKTDPCERFGYTWSQALMREIELINQDQWSLPDTHKVDVVTTGRVCSTDDMKVSRFLARDQINHRHVDNVELWSDLDAASYMAFPQGATAVIAELIDASSRQERPHSENDRPAEPANVMRKGG